MQIQRIGYQCIKRVGGDRYHFASSHGRRRAFDGPHTGALGVDFDQVGCHLQ
jgi:hypothetical protein